MPSARRKVNRPAPRASARPGPFERACARARKLFTKHGFTQAQTPIKDTDAYYRRQRYWGPYTMLRAYVNRMDFEVRLVLEEENRSTPLCTTSELAEVENVLTTSRFRLRFPRTG
jgi:hypothetical protein